MYKSKKQSGSNVIAALLMTTGLIVASLAVPVQAACPQVLPNGKAYEKLSAEWWKWAESFPVSINPLFDQTGANAYLGNQEKVFFLGGVINASGTVTRNITVPAGKPLFFPVVNALWDNVTIRPPYLGGFPRSEPLSVPELYALAAQTVESASGIHASVDGCSIPNLSGYRAQSAPFSYRLPATDNIYQFFGIDVAGVIAPAVSDGYWLFLAPLPVGEHIINFGGTFLNDPGNPSDDFTLNITYHITVTP